MKTQPNDFVEILYLLAQYDYSGNRDKADERYEKTIFSKVLSPF